MGTGTCSAPDSSHPSSTRLCPDRRPFVVEALVVLGDLLAQRFQCRQQRLQCPLQFRTQTFRFFRIHVAHIASAQPLPVTLGQPASRVDKPRACPHQPSAAPESAPDRLAPARCGASPDTATPDRSGPAAPASVHPADRLSCGSPRSNAPCAHSPRSLHAPTRSASD